MKKLFILSFVWVILSSYFSKTEANPYYLPEPKPIFEMIQDSDYVVKAKIDSIHQTTIKPGTISVTCNLQILKIFKANTPIPPQIDLSFLVIPKLYGKFLVSVPPKGEYILFMKQKVFNDSNGKPFESIVLYEPHPYAIQDYSIDLENKIQEFTR
jgi:hypothetical protein